MKSTPDNAADWRSLIKRQVALTVCGGLTILVTAGANKLASSDLLRVEARADADATEAFAWESFNAMVKDYEQRVEVIEDELAALKEGRGCP